MPSVSTAPAVAGATKNQVAKRMGLVSGVVQWTAKARLAAGTRSPASSCASRTAARRAAAASSPSVSARSAASIRPPGNTQ